VEEEIDRTEAAALILRCREETVVLTGGLGRPISAKHVASLTGLTNPNRSIDLRNLFQLLLGMRAGVVRGRTQTLGRKVCDLKIRQRCRPEESNQSSARINSPGAKLNVFKSCREARPIASTSSSMRAVFILIILSAFARSGSATT